MDTQKETEIPTCPVCQNPAPVTIAPGTDLADPVLAPGVLPRPFFLIRSQGWFVCPRSWCPINGSYRDNYREVYDAITESVIAAVATFGMFAPRTAYALEHGSKLGDGLSSLDIIAKAELGLDERQCNTSLYVDSGWTYHRENFWRDVEGNEWYTERVRAYPSWYSTSWGDQGHGRIVAQAQLNLDVAKLSAHIVGTNPHVIRLYQTNAQRLEQEAQVKDARIVEGVERAVRAAWNAKAGELKNMRLNEVRWLPHQDDRYDGRELVVDNQMMAGHPARRVWLIRPGHMSDDLSIRPHTIMVTRKE